jgi:glycosyltransferase involved in cell wall biosynthesis
MGDHRQVAAGRYPTLAAIVPATDGRATLDRCLTAIRDARDPPQELIVVTEPLGIGPAAARNSGATRSTAEVLVFVDADVVVHPDVFVRLRSAFAADPELSALFGSYDDAPEARGAVSAFRNLLHHHVHQTGAGRAATFWSGLGAIRREAFFEVGGFDQKLFSEPQASVEDIDLGMRLAARGARTELDPEVQGTHLKRWTLAEMVRVDFARRGMPWVALLLRNRRNGWSSSPADPGAPAPGRALNLGWPHRLSAAVCVIGVAALLMRRPGITVLSAAALVGLNRPLYALLVRRLGPGGMVAGLGLHAVHHLTAISSAPAGAVLYLRWRERSAAQRS